MDRYLLSGAVLVLTFLIIILLGDMDILPIKLLHFEGETRLEKSIGTVLQTKQNVRRRSSSAIFWENTRKSDELYNYDSILTLENSSSEIKLAGNIKLQLHENTLIVLEPKNEFEQGAFKIRFDRGDLRSKANQRFRVGSGEWVIEAQSGSDLSVKSVTEGNIEVEVHGGEAIVQNEKSKAIQQVNVGQRAVLDAKKQPDVMNVTEDLRFIDRLYQRIYSHDFPVIFKVAWKGNAKKLRILTPGKKIEYIDLTENVRDYAMALTPGSYYFYLESEKQTSESLSVHIWPAEKITYFSPLPRDRIQTGTSSLFSWSELEAAEKYYVHFSSGEEFSSSERRTDVTLATEGEMQWSVYAEDDEGFIIPPPHAYPLYSVPEPLAPPELIEPTLRQPASEEDVEGDDQGTLEKNILEKIFSWIIPTAEAKKNPYRGDLIFEWSKVPGADFYTIEISANPDFRTPEVIVNSDSEKFVWQNYAHEIYYWRVAGGQKQGRMGLFSKVQKLNLKSINSFKGSDISPGVKLVRYVKGLPEKVKASDSKKVVRVPSLPGKPVARVKTTPTPTPVPPPVEEVVEVSNSGTPVLFWVDLIGYYDFSKLKAPENVAANFNGFRPYNLRLGAEVPTGFGYLIANASYSYVIWKPDPEDAYPYQENLKESRMGFGARYRASDSSLSYGLRAEHFGYPEREDLEKIRLKNILFYGPSVNYAFEKSLLDLKSNHTLNILFADKQMQFQWLNEFVYTTPWVVPSELGMELNLKFFNGSDSQSGFLGQFGIFVRGGF